jgi:hypothetical protein
MKGITPLQGEIIAKSKNTLKFLKNLLQNQQAKINQTWYKFFLSKGNSNKGPDPLQRGDNHKNVKMEWCHLKIFSRTIGPI